METLHIFISSPGDVVEERLLARMVIERLQKRYGSSLRLKPIFWEDLPLGAEASFQEGIDLLLSEKYCVEIAVFIIWSRLGSPVGPPPKPDGTLYRSGTEREFALMLEAHHRSAKKRPILLVYTRDDDASFDRELDPAKPDKQLAELIEQRALARSFVKETFQDASGRNLRAYTIYKQPVGFAKWLQTHLCNFIDETRELAGPQWESSPYVGLHSFGLEEAPIYCGRENEVCEVELLLRKRATSGKASVVLVGASGLGKSSLARAGVVHSLTRENFDEKVKAWRFADMQPGMAKGDLFGTLVRALTAPTALPELVEDGTQSLALFQKTLATDPSTALGLKLDSAVRLASKRAGGPVKVLLLVDQLEELWLDEKITLEARETFLRALEALAINGHAWVLATLRSDLYPSALESEAFMRLKSPHEGDDHAGVYELCAPGAAAIHRLITEPAAKAGLRFEKKEGTEHTLDLDLLRDAGSSSDALPLLEYALQLLFERRTPEGVMTFASYDAIGKVAGALGTEAEIVFKSLETPAQDALKEILPMLIAVDAVNDQRLVRRHARRADLVTTEGRRLLTESLIKARFLTSDFLDGEAVAAFTHETLLRKWDRLQVWLADNRELLQFREHVRTAAADWQRERKNRQRRADDLLLSAGLPISRGKKVLEAGILNEEQASFVRLSLAKEKAAQSAKRRQLRTIASISLLAAVVLALLAWQANRKTHEVAKLLAESDAERAERLFAEDDGAAAVWYLCRSVASGAADPRTAERLGFALTQRSWPVPVTAPIPHDAELTAVVFAPRGERFATATRAGTVTVFTNADERPGSVTLLHPKAVYGIQFDPAGTRLLTACDDGIVRLWDVGKSPATLLGESRHDDRVRGVAWNRDGTRYVSGSWDKRLCVWNPEHPETSVFTVEMADRISTVAFDPQNPDRVLGVARNRVGVWEVSSGSIRLNYTAGENLNGALFSADGQIVLPFGERGSIDIVNVGAATQGKAKLPALEPPCAEAVCSSDGKWFALACGNKIRVYSWEEPSVPRWEQSFPDRLTRLKFTPEGKRVVVACADGKVRLLDALHGESLSEPIIEPGIPTGLDFLAAGNRVLCARSTRNVRLWAFSSPAPLPAVVFTQGAVPVLLHEDKEVECISENGRGVIFAPAVGKDAEVAPRQIDFQTTLTVAAVDAVGTVVVGTMDGRVLAWKRAGVQEIAKLDVPVAQLAFSADGTLLAAGDEKGGLALWRRQPEFSRLPFSHPHTDRIGGLALLGSEPMLLSAGWDRRVTVTNLSEQKSSTQTNQSWPIKDDPKVFATDPARHLALVALSNCEVMLIKNAISTPPETSFTEGSQPSHAVFSLDGSMVAVGTVQGNVEIRWTRDGAKISAFKLGDQIDALSFSTNGRWLAVGTAGGQARVFETASGRPVTEIFSVSAPVRQVLLTNDGQSLVTATRDGVMTVWPVAGPGNGEWVSGVARRVMHDQPDGPRFRPGATVLPAPEPKRLRRLIESLRRCDGEDVRQRADLLDSYLNP